jgi:hypothetical protein
MSNCRKYREKKISCFYGARLLHSGGKIAYIVHRVVQTGQLRKIWKIRVFWNENIFTSMHSDESKIPAWNKYTLSATS